MASGKSMDHGHLHDLWWQNRPKTPIWPSATAWTTDTLTHLSSSMDHGPQHGLRWQHRPFTSTWTPLGHQHSFRHSKDHRHPMACHGNIGYGYQHSSQIQQAILLAASGGGRGLSIDMASKGSTVHGCSRESQATSQPGAEARTADTSMSSGCSTDHRYQSGLQGQHGCWRSSEEVHSRKQTILHLSYPVIAQRQGDRAAGQPIQGLSL